MSPGPAAPSVLISKLTPGAAAIRSAMSVSACEKVCPPDENACRMRRSSFPMARPALAKPTHPLPQSAHRTLLRPAALRVS